MIRILILTIAAAVPAPVFAGSICVGNGTSDSLLFAVESRVTGERKLSQLAPDQQVCIEAPDSPDGGVVSVFASLEAEEGCSRLVRGGEPETLLAYSEFDRCEWSSHRTN